MCNSRNPSTRFVIIGCYSDFFPRAIFGLIVRWDSKLTKNKFRMKRFKLYQFLNSLVELRNPFKAGCQFRQNIQHLFRKTK